MVATTIFGNSVDWEIEDLTIEELKYSELKNTLHILKFLLNPLS